MNHTSTTRTLVELRDAAPLTSTGGKNPTVTRHTCALCGRPRTLQVSALVTRTVAGSLAFETLSTSTLDLCNGPCLGTARAALHAVGINPRSYLHTRR